MTNTTSPEFEIVAVLAAGIRVRRGSLVVNAFCRSGETTDDLAALPLAELRVRSVPSCRPGYWRSGS